MAARVRADGTDDPHRTFDGNRPTTTILAHSAPTPAPSAGVIAICTSKGCSTMGVIWGINSFDHVRALDAGQGAGTIRDSPTELTSSSALAARLVDQRT